MAPSSVRVPAPDLVSEPVPEMTAAKVALDVWLKTSALLLAIAPVPKLVVVPLSVPALIVVPPL